MVDLVGGYDRGVLGMLVPTYFRYLPVEKGAKGEIESLVGRLVCGGMDARRIVVRQGLGEFVK